MPDQPRPESRPCRRLLRFSLRGLIVVVLLIGGGLGWIVRSARIQREAVVALTKAGGDVFYDWQWKSNGAVVGGKPSVPAWLVDTFGADYFGNVVAVFMPNASKAELTHIGHLRQLRRLLIGKSEMTDAELAHLKGLTHLSMFDLGDTKVTDAGVSELERAVPGLAVFR